MTPDIEPTDAAKILVEDEILDRFHPANYISLKDFIYENPKGVELKPNSEDFESFNRTFCRFLSVFLPAIIKRVENREGMVDKTINAEYLSEMKNIVTKLEVTSVYFFHSDNTDFLEIKENGEIKIGKALESVLYVVNDDVSLKLWSFDFHHNSYKKNSTMFKINSNLFDKHLKDDKTKIKAKQNILNNSLNSARKLWAKRVTKYFKSKKILCQAYDTKREIVQTEASQWDIDYEVHHSCLIVNKPNSEATPLHNLKVHKDLYSENMKKATQVETDKKFNEIYDANKTKFPYRDQKELINVLIKEFYDRGKVVKKSQIMSSWVIKVEKDNKEWRNRGGRPPKNKEN